MDVRRGLDKLFAWLSSDLGLAVVLFVVGVGSRLPFRSHMLYHWDSVNFALAVERFDMLIHQPHPPGFLLYVLLGRVATLLMGDVNAGYVWISVLCSGLGTVSMFYLGRELFGREAGVSTALLFLVSPSVWFHGEIALTYILEAFMVTALALLWWLMLRRTRVKWLVLGSIGMGLSGGFRLPAMVLLAPLFLFSLRKYRWKWVLVALALASAGALTWLIPTAYQIGGLDRYIRAVFTLSSLSRSASQDTLNATVLFGGESVVQATGRLGMYVIYGMLGGLLPLGYLLVRRGLTWLKSPLRLVRDERAQLLVLWLAPMLLVWAPRVKASGHTLSFLPALLLFAGWGMARLRKDLRSLSWGARMGDALTVGIVFIGIAFFLFAPPYLFGIRRVVFTTPSLASIRYRDEYLSERVAYVLENSVPSDTAVWVTGVDYRHPDYYLRDYTSLQYVEGASPWEDLPVGIEVLVVFSRDLNQVAATVDGAEEAILPGGEAIYTLRLPHATGISQ